MEQKTQFYEHNSVESILDIIYTKSHQPVQDNVMI